MGAQVVDGELSHAFKSIFKLGSETYFAQANTGGLVSDQLVSIKERSMTILNDFITTHNIPHEVSSDEIEVSSNDDDDQEDISATPPVKKSKKRQ